MSLSQARTISIRYLDREKICFVNASAHIKREKTKFIRQTVEIVIRSQSDSVSVRNRLIFSYYFILFGFERDF